MRFSSIFVEGVEHKIAGSFVLYNLDNFLVIFDLINSNHEDIIQVFFNGHSPTFLYVDNNNPESIVFQCNDEYIYMSKPQLNFSIAKSTTTSYDFQDVRIKKCSYIIKGATTDIYKESFSSYSVKSKVHNSFKKFIDFSCTDKSGHPCTTFKYEEATINLILKPNLYGYSSILLIEIFSPTMEDFLYFENLYHLILELITIIGGHSPTLQERILNKGDNIIFLYLTPVDKHISLKHSRNFAPLTEISTSTILNEATLKIYSVSKSRFELIYDLLLYNLNTEIYQDIKINNYVHIIEGFEKSLKGNSKYTTYECLESSFGNSSNKQLLVERDKSVFNEHGQIILLAKARNHRNYLSHLFNEQRHMMFLDHECVYANIKLSSSIRVNILLELNIVPISRLISSIVNDAERIWNYFNSNPM